MKRFLFCAALILVLIVGGLYLFFYRGVYVDLRPDAPMEVPFRTEGQKILARGQDGAYQPLEVRGVDVISSMPGAYGSDFAPEEADYLRWLESIGEMGANLVRVYHVMDADFYNALYQHNTTHAQPLYLLQGLQIADEANNSGKDAFSEDFQGALIREGKTAVDVIHGRKILEATQTAGGGSYWRDLSPWVLGYLVGSDWNADTIAYTDHSTYTPTSYQGEYFGTAEGASSFETMLAQVMDTIMGYESQKYKTQRLIGFNNGPQTDFLEYEELYARQLNKYARLDAEHVVPTDAVRSGYYAGYHLTDMCRDFLNYLSEGQKAQLQEYLSAINTEQTYDGYLDLLGRYHRMPVIAAGYGFSTGRGAVTIGEPPLTEQQQGERLVAVWKEARASGWAGVCISTWQDAWERLAWNTAFAKETAQSYLWHDVQTDGANYGLMAYEPGESPAVLVDGSGEEWARDLPVLTQGDLSLFVRCDQEALYLLIRGREDLKTTPLYLPLDLSQQLGSSRCQEPGVSFDREADFLLCLHGTDNTRLLVQERYDALRENFQRELGKEDPFLSWPEADSPVFVPIGMALRNHTLVDHPEQMSAEQVSTLRALGVWETGLLRHGNGDPDAEQYDSLADFCFGEGCVELRIPWLLLNVANPVDMKIHEDYYQHYGVETTHIDTIWMGLGTGDKVISLHPVDTGDWDWTLTWRERLKDSYQVVQREWSREEAAG